MGNTKMNLLRPRQIILFATTFLTFLTLLSLFETPRNSLKRNLPATPSWILNYGYTPDNTETFIPEPHVPANPLQVLSQLYEDERLHLLHEYDQQISETLVKTAPGALNPDFNAYITRLETFVDSYFNGSAHHDSLMQTLERLTNATPDKRGENAQFEKVVYSFDKYGKDGVPPEYQWWETRLSPEGYEVKVGDDNGMEEWFEESAGRAEPDYISEEEVVDGFALWKEMWHGLGRPVLKSDLLRYLMMLVKGGLYTDSDTAPLSHPDLWGTNANDLTPPALTALQRGMHHLDPEHAHVELDLEHDKSHQIKRGINNPKVNLVVSVEYDVNHPRQDPRFGYTRDLQIVQWTFMAKPFHPVFMDVLDTATTAIMAHRASGNAENNWQSVLDTTGPGPFTDAVLRYLLVQYGVTPQELMGMEGGALIGDVLILPLHAFGSFPGGEEDWNGEDPSTRCTAHGFRGRWKGDINFDRRRSVPWKREHYDI